MFDKLIKAALGTFDGEELFASVITSAGASAAKGPLSRTFQKMRAAGREKLAGQLETVAKHLRAGECDAAANVGAAVIGGIKLK